MSAPGSPDWGRKGRAAAWLNVAVQSLLLLGLVAVVGLIARRSPSRIDLTASRAYALSRTTEDLLRGIDFDLTIWLNKNFYGEVNDKSLAVAIERTDGLLEEFGKRNPRIRIQRMAGPVGPDALHRQHWSTVSPSTVYLLSVDPAKGRANKKAVEIYQLYEGNAMTGELHHYRGEPVLAQSIRELAGGVKRIVYETEGHQELLTADAQALGGLRQLLSANEGIEFRRLATAEYKAVPPDCQVLLIMAPAQPFPAEEAQLVRDYLERGGSLLVAVRPRVKSGLEDLLEQYGVRALDGIVHDPERYLGGRMSNLLVKDFNRHEVNRGMANLGFLMPETAALEPIEKGDPRWKITPLAMSGPRSWLETGDAGPRATPRPDPGERKGDLKLIVAVEAPAPRPQDERHRSCKVSAWGSPSPFLNQVLFPQGGVQEVQYNYLVNHFRWLADRELMEIGHDPVSVKPLDLSPAALVQLRWVVLGGFPAFGILLGILAWFLRRK